VDLTDISRRPDDLFALSEQILQQSQRETFPYEIEVGGLSFGVCANVFSPKHLPAAETFAEALPLTAGIEFLEIGSGIGAVAILAAHAGARRVVATDINPDAVANTRANVERHRLGGRVEVRQGDVFDPIRPDERFDLVFWNMPFGFVEADRRLTPLQRSTLDPGYASARRYITEGRRYLKPEGLLALGFSSTLGRRELIAEFAAEAGLEPRTVHRFEPTPERPYDIELIHLVPRQPTPPAGG
jgi:methylase of polypeptide subunit release factors